MAISEPTTDFYLPATLPRAAEALRILGRIHADTIFDPGDCADLRVLRRIGEEIVEAVDPVFQALAVLAGMNQSGIDRATTAKGLFVIEEIEKRADSLDAAGEAGANDNGG